MVHHSKFSLLTDLLTWRATHQPDQQAFIFLAENQNDLVEQAITYSQLHQQAQTIAYALHNQALAGQRVLLCYPPGLDYITAFFGCLYAGATAVPAYPPDPIRPQRTMDRLQAIVQNSQAQAVLTHSQHLPTLQPLFANTPHAETIQFITSDTLANPDEPIELKVDIQPTDLAFLMYTSGSTGTPKGVMISHANVLHNLSAFTGFAQRPCQTVVSWLPLFHDLGLLLGILHPIYQGARSVLMAPTTFVRTPFRWLQAISTYQATTSGGPNFAYELCLKKISPEERATLDLRSWTMALNGAEPVRAETLHNFANTFAAVGFRPEIAYPSYGMAEATATVAGNGRFAPPLTLTLDRRAIEKRQVILAPSSGPTSIDLVGCGQTLPGQTIKIVDPQTGQLCGPQQIGEIWLSGPSIGQGYWQRPEESAAQFAAHIVGDPSQTAYLRTGDLGFIYQDELFIAGRLKDLIIIRGINHYPEDIEHTVAHCAPGLRPGSAASFAITHDGQEKLVIVHEVNPDEIDDPNLVFGNIREAVATVHDLELHGIALIKPNSLPKTSSGKIRRQDCRQAYESGQLPLVAAWQADANQPTAVANPSPTATHAPSANEAHLISWLIDYFVERQHIPRQEIDIHQSFARYGMGSLASLTLMHDLEKWIGRSLSPTLAWNYPTIADLAHHLSASHQIETSPNNESENYGRYQEPVAIIGMACRFPGGANSPEQLWQLLAQGVDTVKEITPDRWDVDDYYNPRRDTPGKMVTRWGSHLENLDQFDAAFFGISPREAAQLDPRQRLALEGAWEALEDAGIAATDLAGSRTGVFMAVLQDDYGERVFDDYDIVNAYSGSGTANAPVSNRISYFLDLNGPSVSVDTACSGSLVAIHLACQSLLSGETTLALAGGVNIILEPDSDLFMSQAGIISPDGRCKTFDSRADGISRAEGMGIIVLKPLSKAIADGDRVYAVVRGSAVNHDGRSNGLMAPNGTAQEQVINTALKRAGIQPSQLQYVEAHGTGTKLGDPIEVIALGNVLNSTYNPDSYCALGSIKTNIGHAEAAAGIGGVIKIVMAMQHRQLPPNLHFQEPNPLIPFDSLPLVVQQTLGSWPRPQESLIAGINGFGFSGTNAHVLLEAMPQPQPTAVAPHNSIPETALLLPLSARTDAALQDLARSYIDYLSNQSLPPFYNIGHTAATRRVHFNHRATLVGHNPNELLEQLQALANDQTHASLSVGVAPRQPHQLAFIFSGQGTQWPQMGQTLWQEEPVFRAVLDACDRLIQQLAGWSLLDALFKEEAESQIDDTVVAQLAIFSVQVALAALWRSWGIMPDVIVGQSLGEMAAAHVAGALSLEDALTVVYHRSRLMQRVEGAGLTAVVGLPLAEAKLVTLAFRDIVSVAGSSSPTSSLISGDPTAVQRITTSLEEQGTFARLVKGVTIAFHSPQMDPLVGELVDSLANIKPQPTITPLFSTVTGTLIDGLELTADYWGRNLREPFIFSDVLRQLAESGYSSYLEIGPHPVLGGSIIQGLAAVDKEGTVLASLRRGEAERELLLVALGKLYTMGFAVNWQHLYSQPAPVAPLPFYPWQREHYWLDQLNWKSLGEQLAKKRQSGHPLLGEHTAVAVAPHPHFWEMDINANSLPYVQDHQVQGLVVLPGAAYAEIALAASQQALQPTATRIEDLQFKQGLILTDDDSARLQIVLTPEMANEAILQVFSRPTAVADWVEHATGIIRTFTAVDPAPAPLNLPQIQAQCSQQISGETHYQSMSQRGLYYGPAFQAIQTIWRKDGMALSQLQLPSLLGAELASYSLHPVLLDAALQTVAATLAQSENDNQMFLPVGIKRLQIHKPISSPLYCWASLTAVDDENSRSADLVLCDETGQPLATVEGVRLERMVSAAADQSSQSWLYQPSWQQAEPTAVANRNGRPQAATWLIFTTAVDDDPLAELLAQSGDNCFFVRPGDHFRVSQRENVWINPSQLQDYKQLLQQLLPINAPPCRGIIYRWAENIGPDELEKSQQLGLNSVRLLLQALSQTRLTSQPRLWLTSRQAQAITAVEQTIPTQSALWGMGRVLSNEHPEYRVSLVDLPLTTEQTPVSFEELWANSDDNRIGLASDLETSLAEEILANGRENQIAFRGNQRYIGRLARYTAVAATDPEPTPSLTAPFRLEASTPGVLGSLKPQSIPRHKPGPGQVEIEVTAVGLNFKDVMLALGLLPPLPSGMVPLGLECAGRVVAIGEGVTRVKVGDDVLAGGDDCFRRYLITSENLVGLKPANLSFEAAASILVAFGTTHYALNRLGQLQAGERVLIHTGTGATGQAAIQLAKLVGAEIYATAGSPEKRAYLRDELGIAHVMDSRTLDFADQIMALTNGEGVDIVLNTLSGAGLSKSLSVLKPYGRFLELSKRDIVQNSPLRMGALEQNIAYFVVDFNQLMRDKPQYVGQLIDDELLPLFANGRLQPISLQTFSINQATDAFRLMAQAQHIGKVVVSLANEAVPVATAVGQPIEIVANGTYLITGGVGGLGQTVAQDLVAKGARHLVLTSRRQRATLSDEQLQFIEKLEADGAKVWVAQSDVGQADDVAALFQTINETMPPLRGIIHSAGILDDKLLLQMQEQQLMRVLRPKMQGAWHLHQHSQGLPLDFFVLFSSLAAILGSQGQANYAAGNAFMDSLASWRRAQGLPGLSIGWGPWAEVGMAARQGLADQHATGGVAALPPQAALSAMWQLLEEGASHTAVAAIVWPQMANLFPAGMEPPFLADLLKQEAGDTAVGGPMGSLTDELLALPTAEARQQRLQEHLQGITASVFHLDRSRLDVHHSLNALGIDSIMAMELKTKIEKSISGVQISVVDLLRDMTVANLTDRLLSSPTFIVDDEISDLLTEADLLSDVELDTLLDLHDKADEWLN